MKRVISIVVFVGILFSSILFAQEQGWEHKRGEGYINNERSQKMNEVDFFKYGQALLAKGTDYKGRDKVGDASKGLAEAVEVFGLLVRYAEDKNIKGDSLLAKADAYFNLSDYEKAYDAYESFINLYRESPRTREVMKKEMDSAVLLAQKGTPKTLIGISIGSSSSRGLDLLKDALARYPYEEFSAGYYMWLADYYRDDKDYEGAMAEYKFIFDNYKDSDAGAEALYKMAICNLKYVYLTDRNDESMIDAKRNLDRLVELYPKSPITPKAQQILDGLNEKLGERDYEIAEFYMKKDKIISAAFYYRLVLQYYKDTSWAMKATERLKSIQDKVAKLEEEK